MRIGKYEFGLVKPFGWHGFRKDSSCMTGCVIYTLGPFFFTILNTECVELPDEDVKDCIVPIEPFKSPISEQFLNLKQDRREKKLLRKRKNNGKAFPKRKKRISSSKNKK